MKKYGKLRPLVEIFITVLTGGGGNHVVLKYRKFKEPNAPTLYIYPIIIHLPDLAQYGVFTSMVSDRTLADKLPAVVAVADDVAEELLA